MEAKQGTLFDNEFISIQDLINSTGFSYSKCAEMMRGIKSYQDAFQIKGIVHRNDYIAYINRPQAKFYKKYEVKRNET